MITNDRSKLPRWARTKIAILERQVHELTKATTSVRNLWRNVQVWDLGIKIRTRNCLDRAGIRTAGELADTPNIELLSIMNFGESSLQDVKEALSRVQESSTS